jgi:hypothetical protein
MKRGMLGIMFLSSLLFTLGCIRIHVEILDRSGEARAGHTPDETKHIAPQSLPEMDPTRTGNNERLTRAGVLVPTQAATAELCATDRNETPPVAQETGVWCWAASAQAVMQFHKVDVAQCQIVNDVRAEGGLNETGLPYCCESANVYGTQCQKTGYTEDAFDWFGLDYGWSEGALTHRQIAAQICLNGPFIYVIAYEGGGGHTSVVKDYRMDDDGNMFLLVHQHEFYTDDTGRRYPAPFKERQYEYYRNGSYDGWENTLEYNLVQISPLL